jgi:hypothetical protein
LFLLFFITMTGVTSAAKLLIAFVRFGSLADIKERIRESALPLRADMLSVSIDVR